MKQIKALFKPFLLILFTLFLLTFTANKLIIRQSSPFITSNIDSVRNFKAGLLLGTSKRLKNGNSNAFFYNRIEAAASLYKKGKIKYIIVSGDNGTSYYNEPQDMRNELIKQGVPDSVIYSDYAGFRTFDSVIRAEKIFGQGSILIISQEFHNQRAIYIARKNNIKAWGFNATDVTAYSGLKTKLREYFACDKVFIDSWFNVKPKFLGDKIELR